MIDSYDSFSTLTKHARQGRDFRVRLVERPGTTVIVAPHGGGIEPGTSEIAEAIARDDFSFYAFEGTKPRRNCELHITSTRFDEPKGITLITKSPRAISVHGEDSERQVVFLGGTDARILNQLRNSLAVTGFRVEKHRSPFLQGKDPANICNRAANGVGVQLELSRGLRLTFFASLSKSGRRTKTERFHEFVASVRKVIL
jgi:phage replication-related protein YjqB (UPF0714/DUF867 family)